MKAILISIQSPHACNILNLIKLWEIRKKFPSDYVGWVYIYVTKALPLLLKNKDSDKIFINKLKAVEKDDLDRFPHIQKFNGKVVARFWCDKVEEIFTIGMYYHETKTLDKNELPRLSCLSRKDLDNYLQGDNGYAIHITKLEIFDKPKELQNFLVYSHTVDGIGFKGEPKSFQILKPLIKAPQSWRYVED